MKTTAILFLISIVLSVNAFAQYGSEAVTDARSMGMGKTANATSQGVYSLGINPARLVKTEERIDFVTALPLPHVSVSAGTNFITINDINYYFDGKTYSDNDKRNLNSLFNNGGLINGDCSFTLLSFAIRLKPSIGAFAFSINDVVDGNFTVPRAVSSVLLNGNPENSSYSFDDTKLRGWWIRNYSLSYAKKIDEVKTSVFDKLSAGISIKYYQGFAYAKSENLNGNSIRTGTDNVISLNTNYSVKTAFSDNFHVKYAFDTTAKKDAEVSPFSSPAGTGFGIDLGFNVTVCKEYDVALAITDIGGITWNKNTALTYSDMQYSLNDIFNKDQRDSLKNKFKSVSKPVESFSTGLPTTLRFGIARTFDFNDGGSFPGKLLVALDINQGFNDEPGNSTKTRVSFGGEWITARGVPILRTGFSFGGLYGFHWGLGLGIDTGPLEFNFATFDLQSFLKPNSAKYISVALDSRWKF